MPQCPSCGARVDERDDFCAQCGSQLRHGGQSGAAQGAPGGQSQQPRHRPAGQQRRGAGEQPPADRPGGAGPAPQPGTPRQGAGQRPQATGRRDLLKYGVGAAVLAGGGWLLANGGLSGGGSGSTVIEDFEDGSVDDWGGDTAAMAVTSDAPEGERAGRLAFAGHSKAWIDFESRTPSSVSFWWKSDAVSDNELTISLHEYSGDEFASYETAAFGMEVGADNRSRVVVNPPFPNSRSYRTLYEQPRPDTWYETRFFDVDVERARFSVALYDEAGTKLGEVSDHTFGTDVDALDRFQVKNSMNFTGAAAHLDHVRAE